MFLPSQKIQDAEFTEEEECSKVPGAYKNKSAKSEPAGAKPGNHSNHQLQKPQSTNNTKARTFGTTNTKIAEKISTLPELHDAKLPRKPNGCPKASQGGRKFSKKGKVKDYIECLSSRNLEIPTTQDTSSKPRPGANLRISELVSRFEMYCDVL